MCDERTAPCRPSFPRAGVPVGAPVIWASSAVSRQSGVAVAKRTMADRRYSRLWTCPPRSAASSPGCGTIDAELPTDDGVAVFNRMYLTVTERIAAVIADPPVDATTFRDPETMTELDVRFANLWLAAYDADAARRAVPPAWRPLFQARADGRLPVQYAVAGMNTHIEHDLPIAVVGTCRRPWTSRPTDIRP